jgi:hypothetical protein
LYLIPSTSQLLTRVMRTNPPRHKKVAGKTNFGEHMDSVTSHGHLSS